MKRQNKQQEFWVNIVSWGVAIGIFYWFVEWLK